MKKFFLLTMASMMTVFAMAVGRNDGSTKANAIDFDWEAPMEHAGGTKWYVVNLDPLYEEETPALNLFLANKDVRDSAHVSLRATVAGQTDEKFFNIAPKQQRVWSANATMLIRLKQKEIYLTLTSDGPVMMSARVFEAADLDETCRDAKVFNWNTGITQSAGTAIWYKVDLKAAKANTAQDVCVVVTNNGTKKLTLLAGQSLDCPSSGVTRRTIELEAGQTLRDTVPNSMIASVAFNELYVSLENDQPITVRAEYANRPLIPVLPAETSGLYVDKSVPDTALHKNDTMILNAGQNYYFRYTVAELNALKKYEPEFTFRNISGTNVNIDRKMSFEVPAYTAQGNTLVLAQDEESIEVLSKNTLIGLEATYIYVKIKADQDIQLISRFKHLREGKACKTNIDFNWDGGHRQDAKTTQWYAIDLTVAKETLQDVVVYVNNTSDAKATVAAALAFSCPYIDLQEISRPVAAGDTLKHRMAYSTYAMMTDTVWVSINTTQDIKFWAEMVPTKKKAEVDTICLNAVDFNWDEGALQHAGDTVWYRVNMVEVREKAAKFPTVFVQNLSGTDATKITAELSLECPDSIENQKRSLTIAANESYSRQLSRNMFENIKKDTIYLKVITTQDISLQIRLTEEAEGASCSSAIPFNWVSGNTQAADANLWYTVDLREVMQNGNDIRLHVENKDNAECKGVAQLLYECPTNEPPSTQSFTLGKYGTKSITVQNSAFDMLEDSAVYVNVQGSTSIRFWVEILPLKPFDTIYADGLTLIPLQWDTLYTQTVDTAWYIIPKSEIDLIRNMDEKVKPVAHAINLAGTANSIKAEAAFAFPIVKKMMTKTQELKANQHFTDTIPAGTFDQFLKKDSIILRVTRPAGSGNFQFRAELVKAFSGNSRYDALPIRLGENYYQEGMTSMWYKVNTVDLKNTKDLFNKCLTIHTGNVGAADANVKLAVYEGLMSDVDLLEDYGLSDYRERTIKKGQRQDRSIPAQAVLGLGDVELYIQVTTTEPMEFRSKLSADYAPIAPDPKQQEATLLVPNVEYVLPGDNQEHWYMVCLPYIQNNYIYTEGSMLQYELNGTATIEATCTFQDTMTYKMPTRKRTINKSGGYHKGKKPLRELIEKGLKKAGHPFDFSGTDPAFMDSLLHRFITKDSVTFYIRIKSDKELKAKLITPQTTGDGCTTPMTFDWEHGNVNPAGADTWYYVYLDPSIVPDTCDLRLHVDNWAVDSAHVAADLYFDCNDPATISKKYKQGANGKDTLDIDRDFLVKLGWTDMLINYYSDRTSHIWAELIPNKPRECDYDTVRAFVCQGGSFTDTITNIVYDPVDYSMQWNDTVAWEDGVTMRDSVTTFIVRPLVSPVVLTYAEMLAMDAAPLLVQGMQLNVDASNAALMAYYQNLGNTVDTIITVDTVYWATPVYKSNGDLDIKKENPLDLTTFYTKNDDTDTLLLVIRGGCSTVLRQDVVFPVGAYKYVAKNDTLCPPAPVKNPDTLAYQVLVPDTLGLLRQIDTVVTYYARVQPNLYTDTQVSLLPVVANDAAIDTTFTLNSLKQQFENDATDLTMKVTDAKWQVEVAGAWQDLPYSVSHTETLVTMRYVINTECGDVLNSANILFPLVPSCDDDTIKMATPIESCGTYHWAIDGQDYAATGKYYYDAGVISGTCHQYIELNLIVKQPGYGSDMVVGCESVTYKGVTYTSSTTINDTLAVPAANGCDSIILVNIIVNQPATGVDALSGCGSVTFKGVNYTSDATVFDTIPNGAVNGCDSIVAVSITVKQPTASDTIAIECDSFTWHGTTYTTSGDYDFVMPNAAGCDSTRTLHLTIKHSNTGDTTAVECDEFTWYGTKYTASGNYTHTLTNVAGCDSVVTLHLTIHNSASVTAPAITECNSYYWTAADTTIITSGSYTHVFQTVNGCDSVVTLPVTINTPYQTTLSLVHKFGNRLLMINRNEINAIPGWSLDSLGVEHPEYVTWYEIDPAGNEKVVGTGYYYNLASGEPLPTGYTYYAVIDIPASAGATCGAKGETVRYTIPAPAGAPALVPSLAKPGEDIRIINLDPETQTIVRIYTAEGLMQGMYTVTGEDSFIIKAADAYGFYMVELSNENLETTLRYIVK